MIELIKFKDGRYEIRKRDFLWGRPSYWNFTLGMWWDARTEGTRSTEAAARRKYERLTDSGEVVK